MADKLAEALARPGAAGTAPPQDAILQMFIARLDLAEIIMCALGSHPYVPPPHCGPVHGVSSAVERSPHLFQGQQLPSGVLHRLDRVSWRCGAHSLMCAS